MDEEHMHTALNRFSNMKVVHAIVSSLLSLKAHKKYESRENEKLSSWILHSLSNLIFYHNDLSKSSYGGYIWL